MKVTQLYTCFGLAVAFTFFAGDSWAFQSIGGKDKPTVTKKDKPKYMFHEASTLSGIDVQPNKQTGTFLLKFDQLLPETGFLQVKNTAGKVLFASTILPAKERTSHSMDIGKLTPGVYSIEVKTSDATFWKKVRIRK
jgi:hypothetical protein